MATEVAIYFDASKCSACKGCQINCKQWNQNPSPMEQSEMPWTGTFENPKENDGDTWLHIRFNEDTLDRDKGYGWAFGRNACQHCTDAACVEACPTGACHKVDNGSVVIEPDQCIGCKYCIAACPFDIPKYSDREGITRKCWLCQDKVSNGQRPSCVSTCPTGALQFGPRDEMITMAHARADEIKGIRPETIVYGENEMGGLHVIQVLPFGAEAHGLPVDPATYITTTLSKAVKPVMGVGMIAMLGLVAASYIGGRGYKRGIDELSFDPAHPGRDITDARDSDSYNIPDDPDAEAAQAAETDIPKGGE